MKLAERLIGYIGITAFVLCGCSLDSLFTGGWPFVLGCFGVTVICGYAAIRKEKNERYGNCKH